MASDSGGEAIVGGILAIILGLMGIILLLGAFYFLIQVLWFSVVAWLSAAAAFALFFIGTSLFLRPNKTTLIKAVEINPRSLTWEYSSAVVEKEKHTSISAAVSAALAIAVLVLTLLGQYRSGRLDFVIWWWGFLGDSARVSPLAVLVMAIVLSLIILGLAIYFIVMYIGGLNVRATEQLVRVMNSDRGHADAYLASAERLGLLVDQLGIRLDQPYAIDLLTFCRKEKARLATQPWKIGPKVDEARKAIGRDIHYLAKAKSQMDEAQELLQRTSKLVKRTGSKPLIVDLEDMYEGLESEELAGLLCTRQWETHQGVIDEMKADLMHLRAMAEKYLESGEWEEEREFSNESDLGSMDEARACEILQVPVSASNDDIHKMYHELVKLWHPDVGKATEDGKMKKINAAYEYLREERSI